MSRILTAVLLAGAIWTAHAAQWKNLDDASWCAGPKVSADELFGKVVLVNCWGVDHKTSRAIQPRMEQIWSSFKGKPFQLIGSVRGAATADEAKAAVRELKTTFPTYLAGGVVSEPNFTTLPYFYVVNHRGRVVYSGIDERQATEALVTAFGQIGGPASLIPGVSLNKYRSLEKQLVFGKSVKNIVKKLEDDVRKAGGKIATKVQKENAVEAREILAAIAGAKKDAREEIEVLKAHDPENAVRFIGEYVKTFPDEAAEFKEVLSELAPRAEEAKKARLAKGKATKAEGKKAK